MNKTVSKCAQLFVGVHVLIWIIYLAYDGIIGADDMNFGMVLIMLIWFMDMPSAWVIEFLGGGNAALLVFFLGTAQWYVMGLIAGAGYHRFVVAKRLARPSDSVDVEDDSLAH